MLKACFGDQSVRERNWLYESGSSTLSLYYSLVLIIRISLEHCTGSTSKFISVALPTNSLRCAESNHDEWSWSEPSSFIPNTTRALPPKPGDCALLEGFVSGKSLKRRFVLIKARVGDCDWSMLSFGRRVDWFGPKLNKSKRLRCSIYIGPSPNRTRMNKRSRAHLQPVHHVTRVEPGSSTKLSLLNVVYWIIRCARLDYSGQREKVRKTAAEKKTRVASKLATGDIQ